MLGIKAGLLNHKALALSDGYKLWMFVSLAIKNSFGLTERGYALWDSFCKIKEAKYDPEESRKHYTDVRDVTDKKKPLGFASLIYWMKETDTEKTKAIIHQVKKAEKDKEVKESKTEKEYLGIPTSEWYNSQSNDTKTTYDILIEPCIQNTNDYNFALACNTIFGDTIVCTDIQKMTCQEYTKNCWKETQGVDIRMLLSTKFHDIIFAARYNILIQQPIDEAKDTIIRRLLGCMQKLKRTCNKNNIYKEILHLAYQANFLDGFNTTKNVHPIKDGLLFDMLTNTTRPRTQDDKFNYECPVEYIEYGLTMADKYFNDVCCGDTETLQSCFIDCIKTTFSGTILRHLFICSGDGNNGKSLLFKALGMIFDKGMDTIQ
jgi:hypothetical protein